MVPSSANYLGSTQVPSGPNILHAHEQEQIWNRPVADAIYGDNLRADGLIGPRKRIGSPQQVAEDRGARSGLMNSAAFGVESGDGGKRQQSHSGWKSRQGS